MNTELIIKENYLTSLINIQNRSDGWNLFIKEFKKLKSEESGVLANKFLSIACREKKEYAVDFLISMGANLNWNKEDKYLPAFWEYFCLYNRNDDFFKFLIARGADINTVIGRMDKMQTMTLLTNYVSLNYFDNVKFLVELGADIQKQVPNRLGNNAIEMARGLGYRDIDKYLISALEKQNLEAQIFSNNNSSNVILKI